MPGNADVREVGTKEQRHGHINECAEKSGRLGETRLKTHKEEAPKKGK
jgi:hypothetical protein